MAPSRPPICAVITPWKKFLGARAANGATGIRNPAATPASQVSVRLPVLIISTSRISTGTMAHASIRPANPNATPPQTSRLRLLVNVSPSNTATAPIRQNSTTHGSTSRVCEDATLSA